MHAVGVGVDADAGQAEHRLGDFADRWIARGLHQDRVVAVGADGDGRGQRGVEHVQNFFGRLLIGGFAGQNERGCDQKEER